MYREKRTSLVMIGLQTSQFDCPQRPLPQAVTDGLTNVYFRYWQSKFTSIHNAARRKTDVEISIQFVLPKISIEHANGKFPKSKTNHAVQHVTTGRTHSANYLWSFDVRIFVCNVENVIIVMFSLSALYSNKFPVL